MIAYRVSEVTAQGPKTGPHPSCTFAQPRRAAFTLMELIVVLAVTVLLTSLLMPALSGLKNHADRLISQSNLRQVGMGFTMYHTDNMNRLPLSRLVRSGQLRLLQEMQVTRLAADDRIVASLAPSFDTNSHSGFRDDPDLWEGMGLLYSNVYINAPEVFYSPAYRGFHTWERYAEQYRTPGTTIYSNYHYRGDIDILRDDHRALNLTRDSDRVILTDGMRTRDDRNDRYGFHVLYGNGRVEWKSDPTSRFFDLLPNGVVSDQEAENIYNQIWRWLDGEDDDDGDG